MKFLDKLNKQMAILTEADGAAPAAAPEADAAAPDPNAAAAPAAPEAPAPVAPEGYVDLVRLISKAAAMNFPAGALDEIFRTEITAENAFPIQTALEAVIKQNEMYGDNPERLLNPHYKHFIESVNNKNFIEKYKHLLAALQKQDPYLKANGSV